MKAVVDLPASYGYSRSALSCLTCLTMAGIPLDALGAEAPAAVAGSALGQLLP